MHMMWLRRTVSAHDAHSWFVTVALALLGLTLVIDLVFHRDMTNKWLIWALLLTCVIGVCVAFSVGAALPNTVGIVGVCVFFLAQSYFLSLSGDAQSATSSVQQLPLAGFYLGWFVRPRWAFLLIASATGLLCWVMVNNPLFWANGVIGPPVAVHGLLILLFCFVAGSYMWHRNARAAGTDSLTGVRTRQSFLTKLDALLRRSDRRHVSIIAVDFDGLKFVNDTQGHAVGDLVLIDSTDEWREALPSDAVIGRLGGDEFVIALPGVSLADAHELSLRLRAAAAHSWSYGLAAARPSETAALLLHRADTELYRAKRRVGGEHAQ